MSQKLLFSGDSLVVEQSPNRVAGGGSIPTSSLHIHTIARLEKDFTLARNFVNQHHSYIRWTDRPSRKLYWLLYERDRVVGVFGLSSGFVKPKAMADLIKMKGWTFNQIANNVVYCLAGCEQPNSGSQFLRLLRKDGIVRWKERYGDELKCIQTFILPPLTGAVYKADNWRAIGTTRGGKTLRKQYYCHPREGAKEVKFKGGEIKYQVKSFAEVAPKLILVWETRK